MQSMEPLVTMYGRPKKIDSELTAWWLLYFEALSSLPRIALDYAVSEYIRTSTIHMIPAPGILTKLAQPWYLLIGTAYNRCRRVRSMPEPRQPISAEERARVRQMMDEMKGPDGRVRLPPRTGSNPMYPPAPPRESRQQAAERIRSYGERRDIRPLD